MAAALSASLYVVLHLLLTGVRAATLSCWNLITFSVDNHPLARFAMEATTAVATGLLARWQLSRTRRDHERAVESVTATWSDVNLGIGDPVPLHRPVETTTPPRRRDAPAVPRERLPTPARGTPPVVAPNPGPAPAPPEKPKASWPRRPALTQVRGDVGTSTRRNALRSAALSLAHSQAPPAAASATVRGANPLHRRHPVETEHAAQRHQLPSTASREAATRHDRNGVPAPPAGAAVAATQGASQSSAGQGKTESEAREERTMSGGDGGERASRLSSRRATRRGAWNIGTANVRFKSSPAEFAVMAEAHNLDIVALTEVNVARSTDCTNFGSRVLWQGFGQGTVRGVGWCVRSGPGAPRVIDTKWYGPRVSTLVTRWRSTTVTFVGLYGPATDDHEACEAFREALDTALAAVRGRPVLLGDSNAHVGFRHGDNNCPQPSRWFLDFLEEEDLVLANFDTGLVKRRRATFVTSRLSGTGSKRKPRVLDVIATPRRFREAVRGTRPVRMLLEGADHRLVRARFRPTWRKDSHTEERDPPPAPAGPGPVGDAWKRLTEAYTAVEQERASPYRVEWATDEVRAAISAKAAAYKAHCELGTAQSRRAYVKARREANRTLRRATREYWDLWATAVEDDVNAGRTSNAYKRLRPKYKPRATKMPSDDIAGCRGHFANLLGPPPLPPQGDGRWDQLPCAAARDIDDSVPDDEEVEKALRALTDSAPGRDRMRAGTLKLVPSDVAKLVRECWRTRTIPPAFQEAVLVALPKKPGASAWTDHRGITLLCVPSKVLARVMLARLKAVELLPEQCGFTAGSSTADAVAAVKTMVDEGRRCGVPLVFTFVDLTKAYDTIPRELVWNTLRRIGAGPTLIGLLQAMYEDRIYVRSGAVMSPTPFSSTQGVRQGCLLSPLLFNLVFDRVLRALQTEMPGVRFGVRFERFRAYADDLVLISGTRAQAQRDVDAMQRIFDVAGLTLSTGKTCVMQLDVQQSSEPQAAEGVLRTPDGDEYVVPEKRNDGTWGCPATGCTKSYARREGVTHHVRDAHAITAVVLEKPPVRKRVYDVVWQDGTTHCGTCGKTGPSSTIQAHCKAKDHTRWSWVRADGKPIRCGGNGAPTTTRAEIRRRDKEAAGVLATEPEPEVITARDPSGNRVALANVSEFKYLGRVIANRGNDEVAVFARIRDAGNAANAIFHRGRLRKASKKTRLRVYQAIVHAKLVYCAETWVLTDRARRGLDAFQQKWLRRLTGCTPSRDGTALKFPPRAEVLKAANAERLSDQIDVQRLRFFGHTMRRPSAVKGSLLPDGRVGFRQSLTLQGQLRQLAAEAGAPTDEQALFEAALDRQRWRGLVSTLRQRRHDAAHAPAA